MKKIFDFGKKEQFPPCPPFKLPNFFGLHTSNYIPGYVIQSKDLPKIHKAALLGDVAKVQHLLLFGKNSVNDVDREKRTCLHLACANGHPDVVSLLIERKCDLNLLDTDHRTPFMKAIQCEEVECATLLLEHGADPNLGDGSNNALHYVAFFQNVDMTSKLLQYKADIDAKNKEGLTPLFFAIRAKKFDIAEFLLKNGANVNALDGYKRTTLMVAVSMQFTEMVSLLLEYNVDHTIKDELGRSAEKYARTYNYPLHAYVKQIEKYMERNKPCISQISCSKEATFVPGFVLKASSLNKKVAEKSSTEESISRLSEKPRPEDPCPSTRDELNFEMEKLPKLKLTKTINTLQHMTKIKHMDNIVYTKVTPFYEDNQSLSDIEDLTDSFPESSSQAQSPHLVPPPPAYFAKPSLMKSTLLNIFREDSEDSEDDEKKNAVLVDNIRGKKTGRETRNIHYQLQAHNTTEKCAARKALEEEEDTVSSWDSEEYPKDSEVEEKKNDVLIDNNSSKETTSETPNIPNELQAHSTSKKCAARKALGLQKEEDTDSTWDSEECPTDSEKEAKENNVLVEKDTVKHISCETPNIPNQLQAHGTSEICAERKGKYCFDRTPDFIVLGNRQGINF